MQRAWIGLADPNVGFFARHDKKRGVSDSVNGPAAAHRRQIKGRLSLSRRDKVIVAWRGAALARNRRPRDICLDARMTGNLLKQAAPGNVSTRVRFVGTTPG